MQIEWLPVESCALHTNLKFGKMVEYDLTKIFRKRATHIRPANKMAAIFQDAH